MIKKFLIIGLLAGVGLIFFNLLQVYHVPTVLNNKLGAFYAQNAAKEVGAANLVSAIVVTYRGFDTLGEVTILFLTAAIISFVLKMKKEDVMPERHTSPNSEILVFSSQIIVPVIFMVGIYIFINGHLTPGGGFQGGAVIASGVLLMLLANPRMEVNHKLVAFIESISGIAFVIAGILGIIFAGGFLDNRFLSLGVFGTLLSAGALPLIYIFIGLKVGAELSNIIGTISYNQNEKNS